VQSAYENAGLILEEKELGGDSGIHISESEDESEGQLLVSDFFLVHASSASAHRWWHKNIMLLKR
jgi:hypothetical protein